MRWLIVAGSLLLAFALIEIYLRLVPENTDHKYDERD